MVEDQELCRQKESRGEAAACTALPFWGPQRCCMLGLPRCNSGHGELRKKKKGFTAWCYSQIAYSIIQVLDLSVISSNFFTIAQTAYKYTWNKFISHIPLPSWASGFMTRHLPCSEQGGKARNWERNSPLQQSLGWWRQREWRADLSAVRQQKTWRNGEQLQLTPVTSCPRPGCCTSIYGAAQGRQWLFGVVMGMARWARWRISNSSTRCLLLSFI